MAEECEKDPPCQRRPRAASEVGRRGLAGLAGFTYIIMEKEILRERERERERMALRLFYAIHWASLIWKISKGQMLLLQ